MWLQQRGKRQEEQGQSQKALTAFDSKSNGKALAGFEQRNYVLQFMCFKSLLWLPCGAHAGQGTAREKAGSPLGRLFPDSRCKTLKTWIRVKTMEI